MDLESEVGVWSFPIVCKDYMDIFNKDKNQIKALKTAQRDVISKTLHCQKMDARKENQINKLI